MQSSLAIRIHVIMAQFSGSSAKANSVPLGTYLPADSWLFATSCLLTVLAVPDAD